MAESKRCVSMSFATNTNKRLRRLLEAFDFFALSNRLMRQQNVFVSRLNLAPASFGWNRDEPSRDGMCVLCLCLPIMSMWCTNDFHNVNSLVNVAHKQTQRIKFNEKTNGELSQRGNNKLASNETKILSVWQNMERGIQKIDMVCISIGQKISGYHINTHKQKVYAPVKMPAAWWLDALNISTTSMPWRSTSSCTLLSLPLFIIISGRVSLLVNGKWDAT